MKILVTGNPNFGLAESISKIYTDAKFVTKSAGFDLTSSIKQDELSNIALDYDVFVLCSYIPDYVPNILLQKVYDNCKKNNHKIHIIVIGSTVDRVNDGRVWKYAEEKKALRDVNDQLYYEGVDTCIINFGFFDSERVADIDRPKMSIEYCISIIEWILKQPHRVKEITVCP